MAQSLKRGWGVGGGRGGGLFKSGILFAWDRRNVAHKVHSTGAHVLSRRATDAWTACESRMSACARGVRDMRTPRDGARPCSDAW